MRLSVLLLSTVLVLPSAAHAQARLARSQMAMTPPVYQEDAALRAAVASPTRPAGDISRDVFRHPVEALTFWGLTPGATIVEIEPGSGGWWSAILQPYAQATGGHYAAVNRPVESMGVEDGSADLVLVARAIHNWARDGRTDPYMAAFFKALKPGGVLAVEQHRAPDGLDAAVTASTGYVPESYVVDAALRAGFVLEARSELNANARDDHDHPFGVWTLPPVRRSTQNGRTLSVTERAAYDAIGESDRMTLRFRRPE
ncbi:methyltransferase [uncultured Brevundimonas sp.]|uniref:class I SAM-dependent methyltransferase n=1 Tax=uncultured Brevundimonas sp. TaxID=213418 RepID=UPI0030ED5944|tara:strand:+ start:138433 stop:139203 length:771 start_codon:yes stop_codon:yes gene_type:complete